jgi:hypothetical protein
MDTFDADALDSDGYPTDSALEALDRFKGTPQALACYVSSMMENYGSALVEDFVDDFGGVPSKRLTLVTGGWSGCESVVSALSNTLFYYAFWESSWRGGKHTYVVPDRLWSDSGQWGNPAVARG